MRYSLAGKDALARFTQGSGLATGILGLVKGLGRRALGPLAIPAAVGAGLVWLGRSLADAFVDVTDEGVHVKLGALFDEIIPIASIEAVERTRWSLLGGLGLRSNLRDMVAVTTTTGEVAELRLRQPIPLPVIPKIWKVDATRLVVSPEDLDGFVAELRAKLDAADR